VKLDVKTATGAAAGTVDVPDELFGIVPNTSVMHQVVTAQLAAARSGTHSTKTRAEVRGGGAKPWRQKGTGRARQGSIRAPHWRGGGVAHGPKPRDYRQRTPKKMIRLALRSALSDRAAEGKVLVLDGWGIDTPRTKDAIELLATLGLRTPGERDARVLLVLARDEEAVWRSFRNLGERVQIVIPDELNTYDVLVNDWLVFTKATLESVIARFGSKHASDPVGEQPGVPVAIEAASDEEGGDK
jgi:large subunit ribosomal protein L4